MIEILLLIIACCLLFGSEKTKAGIGCLLKVIAMLVIGVIILIFICGVPEPSTDEETYIVTQDEINYLEVTVDELTDALANDIDSAKSAYLNQYVSVSGRFAVINLYEDLRVEGLNKDTLYLSDIDDYSNPPWVICYMQTDEQREKFKQFAENDIVTVKGRITDIDEFSYTLEIDSID